MLVGSGGDSSLESEDVINISFCKIGLSLVSNLFLFSLDLAESDMVLFEKICAN